MAASYDETSVQHETDNFKHVYKRYKRRDRPLNTDDVINFANGRNISPDTVEAFPLHVPEEVPDFPGLKPLKEWKAYQLKHKKGFIVIPNPFQPGYQRYWIQRCLLDFATKPNTTNVDAHMDRPAQIWHTCLKDGVPDLRKDSLLMKLRWATLGYQYEWNTKEYFSDQVQMFPDDLNHLCRYIAAALGYGSYSSEAGIVNYYRMDSSLMAHTDVSELDKAAPLISFSFGQSCIFLIGGLTKATEPVSLFLNSGDISLMTGPARLSFHAVPRIVHTNTDYLHSCFYGNSHNSEMDVDSSNKTDASGLQENNKTALTETDTTCTMDTDTDDDPYNSLSKDEQMKRAFERLNECAEKNKNNQEPPIVTPTVKGDDCSLSKLEELMKSVISDEDWRPFDMYLGTSRVNVNVRQVLKEGMSLKPRPNKIVPCQRNIKKAET